MKKGTKKVEKKVVKVCTIESSKVVNTVYRYYRIDKSGYIKTHDALVSATVVKVTIDLKNQLVTSVLRDSYGNLYTFCGDYDMYRHPEHYEQNEPMEKARQTTDDALKCADYKRLSECELRHVKDDTSDDHTDYVYLEVWTFENGEAHNVPVEINSISISEGERYWHLDDGYLPEKLWWSRKLAYDCNEYEVVDEDGEVFTEHGVQKRLFLTKKQADILKRLNDTFKEAEDAGIRFIWDRDNCGNVKAFNGEHVEEYGYDITTETNSDMRYFNDVCFHQTTIGFYDCCLCDGNDRIVMKQTPRQQKEWKKAHPDA